MSRGEQRIDPDRLFVDLMIAKRYRTLRHVILWLIAIMLGMGNLYNLTADNWPWVAMLVILAMAPILLNVYVLVPKLLLRDRFYLYTAVTVIMVVVVLLLATYSQFMFRSDFLEYQEKHRGILRYILLNNLSTAILFALIITGTTSGIILQLWLRDQKRISELKEAASAAELDMLKSQINPHFLFNMLNNAIVLTREHPAQGRETILKLREMLDYQFATSHAREIALKKDVDFLGDLLHLEKLRRDWFDYSITVRGEIGQVKVPPLLFIPFVENAIKHGNDSSRSSYILILFTVEENVLRFFCSNSVPDHTAAAGEGGLGLRNIKRRLELIYGKEHTLDIKSNDKTYDVNLTISL